MGVEDLQIPRVLVRKGSPGSHIFLSKDGISKISRDVDGGSASLKIKQGHDDCTKKRKEKWLHVYILTVCGFQKWESMIVIEKSSSEGPCPVDWPIAICETVPMTALRWILNFKKMFNDVMGQMVIMVNVIC